MTEGGGDQAKGGREGGCMTEGGGGPDQGREVGCMTVFQQQQQQGELRTSCRSFAAAATISADCSMGAEIVLVVLAWGGACRMMEGGERFICKGAYRGVEGTG